MTREERETLIRWSAADKTVTIDSADAAVIRKLDKLCAEHPEVYSVTRADEVYKAKRYSLTDARYIRFGKPASEAMREACRKKAEHLRSKLS